MSFVYVVRDFFYLCLTEEAVSTFASCGVEGAKEIGFDDSSAVPQKTHSSSKCHLSTHNPRFLSTQRCRHCRMILLRRRISCRYQSFCQNIKPLEARLASSQGMPLAARRRHHRRGKRLHDRRRPESPEPRGHRQVLPQYSLRGCGPPHADVDSS